MSLRTSNLRFFYRAGHDVLDQVSVTCAPGTLTAIIGPNGSGKSTLVRLLLGVLRPVEGTVRLDDGPVHELRGARRAARMGYLAQRTQLAEPLGVAQVVALGRYARPHDPEAVSRALALVGSATLADEVFGELSVGQQQRVALARVLAQLDGGETERAGQVILADEPVSAQDPKHVAAIMELLWREAHPGVGDGGGRAVVVVLHDLTLAARYADQVVVLTSRGRVAAAGKAADVLKPEVLDPVFDVSFERVERTPGDPRSAAILAKF